MEDCVTNRVIIGKKWDTIKASFEPKRFRLSFRQFTIGRLRDLSAYHTGCMGSIRASFETKRSKIGLETVELWPIYQWEVA